MAAQQWKQRPVRSTRFALPRAATTRGFAEPLRRCVAGQGSCLPVAQPDRQCPERTAGGPYDRRGHRTDPARCPACGPFATPRSAWTTTRGVPSNPRGSLLPAVAHSARRTHRSPFAICHSRFAPARSFVVAAGLGVRAALCAHDSAPLRRWVHRKENLWSSAKVVLPRPT